MNDVPKDDLAPSAKEKAEGARGPSDPPGDRGSLQESHLGPAGDPAEGKAGPAVRKEQKAQG